jgi:hypothetical protein
MGRQGGQHLGPQWAWAAVQLQQERHQPHF